MNITIPDAIAESLAAEGQDPARAALEAIALEGCRSERLSEYQVQQMLGYEYFEDVHRFLNEHGVYPAYTMEDVERDTATALEVAQRARKEDPLASELR